VVDASPKAKREFVRVWWDDIEDVRCEVDQIEEAQKQNADDAV
jgi:hypothetical protein